MPASFRRLRLLCGFVPRDGRILSLQRGRVSNAAVIRDNYHNNSTTTAFTRASVTTGGSSRQISQLSGRGRGQRRSESTTSIANNLRVTPAVAATAGFHSSPLSWFAAEAEEGDKPVDPAAGAGEAGGEEEPAATDIDYDMAPPLPLSKASQDKVQAIFDKVLWLDMIEVHLLTQIVNEQMGISWKETEMRQKGGGLVKVAGPGAAAEAEEPAEEKTIFDLKLTGFDAKAKIKVIKEVRTIAGLGLKEAKEMVEGAPKIVQKELKLEKAEELKAQLEAVGATVELV